MAATPTAMQMKKNSSQTQVTYSCQLHPTTKDTIAAREVLAAVLSDDAWLALREQTGASYGAYAYSYDWSKGYQHNDPAAMPPQVFVHNIKEEGELKRKPT